MTTTDGAAPIKTEGLTKHYGDVKALVGLDLEVQHGEVFGFLGPNGAGKTTTIRSLLHFLFPTSGKATVLGLDVATNAVEVRSRVAYMPSEYSLYPKLTGAENLTYLANLRGGVDMGYVAQLAERLEVDLGRKVGDLSTGNKQKVGLIQAFMSKAELVILDEPSTGLDPLMQQELQALIREVREDGRTVFLSSHSLAEVERVADRVGILRHGHLVVVEPLASLKRKAIRRIDLEFDQPVNAAVFEGIEGVHSAETRGNSVVVSFEGSVNALLRAALDQNVVNVNSREADLEQIFLTYYTNGGPDVA
jgi:ABC-2 type transport system ATP-binding protein